MFVVSQNRQDIISADICRFYRIRDTIHAEVRASGKTVCLGIYKSNQAALTVFGELIMALEAGRIVYHMPEAVR